MSGVEVTWLMHQQMIDTLKETHANRVRQYLLEAEDFSALAEWDNSKTKDSGL